MTKSYQFIIYFFMLLIVLLIFISCNGNSGNNVNNLTSIAEDTDAIIGVDTLQIPNDKFGVAVRYGRELMLRTAYYIGPDGINGKYLGNKMKHQRIAHLIISTMLFLKACKQLWPFHSGEG